MQILFVQTGGTIDKTYPMGATNHGYNFEISAPAYERILQRVNPSFTFQSQSILQKDSTDLTDQDRAFIVQTCRQSSARTIIITHGTDTMVHTAEALSILHDKVIILTGALSPEVFKDSDADFNLGVAIGAAAALQPGVYIAMSGLVMEWHEAEFSDAHRRFVRKRAATRAALGRTQPQPRA